MTMVPVKLTNAEWTARCEELAKEELLLHEKELAAQSELEEWKDHKKGLDKDIADSKRIVQTLAKEVDTRMTWKKAQHDLPMPGAEG
jgi:hypothetical protein